jgi:hypothetical protein
MIGIINTTSFNCALAQNDPHDNQIMKMLRDFYSSYMNEFTDLSTGHEQKTNAILKKYCTADLIKKIPKLMEQMDADPILKTQDSDSAWVKSLVIIKDLKRSSVYIVSYVDGGNTETTIHLLVVDQNEKYKVADVW